MIISTWSQIDVFLVNINLTVIFQRCLKHSCHIHVCIQFVFHLCQIPMSNWKNSKIISISHYSVYPVFFTTQINMCYSLWVHFWFSLGILNAVISLCSKCHNIAKEHTMQPEIQPSIKWVPLNMHVSFLWTTLIDIFISNIQW